MANQIVPFHSGTATATAIWIWIEIGRISIESGVCLIWGIANASWIWFSILIYASVLLVSAISIVIGIGENLISIWILIWIERVIGV